METGESFSYMGMGNISYFYHRYSWAAFFVKASTTIGDDVTCRGGETKVWNIWELSEMVTTVYCCNKEWGEKGVGQQKRGMEWSRPMHQIWGIFWSIILIISILLVILSLLVSASHIEHTHIIHRHIAISPLILPSPMDWIRHAGKGSCAI